MSKQNLDSFAPEMRKRMAKNSGFLQCRTCGLIWLASPLKRHAQKPQPWPGRSRRSGLPGLRS